MSVSGQIRLARPEDFEALGDLRWRLATDDTDDFDPAAHDQFISDCVEVLARRDAGDGLYHWVAEVDGRVIAAMSVQTVRQLPEPGRMDGAWGYLTNCYTLPEYRDKGVGSELLDAVRDWAAARDFELLVVWPSDRAYAFYERADFRKYPDPLVLKLRDED